MTSSPGKNRLAQARSTTTTSSRSDCSSSRRPRSSVRPVAWKKPVETPTHGQTGWFSPAGVGRSSRSKLLVWPLSLGGRLSDSAALCTPGSAVSRSTARFQNASRSAGCGYLARGSETDAVSMLRRVDADRHVAQAIEAGEDERASDEERRGQRELGGDQRALHAARRRRVGGRSPAGAERLIDPQPRAVPGRHDADDDAAGRGQARQPRDGGRRRSAPRRCAARSRRRRPRSGAGRAR